MISITVSISMAIISIAWLSRSLAIVSMVTISMSIAISMTIISIAWLSISGPLAIISMVSITTISMTIITIPRLGLSGPLAIVSMVAISISMSITMAIVAISRLSNSHTQEGKRNSKQKFHVVSCSF